MLHTSSGSRCLASRAQLSGRCQRQRLTASWSLGSIQALIKPLRAYRLTPPNCRTAAHSSGSFPPGTSSNVVPGHPDALRRRREAEERRASRLAELTELKSVGDQWWQHQTPSNMLTVSSRREYQQALEQCKERYGLVVVDFFAPWCAGCRMLYPKLRQIASANLDVAFIKVNTEYEEMQELSVELGVTGLPFFNLHCGQKVEAFAANLTKVSRLRTEIDNLKATVAATAADTGRVLQLS